MRLIDADAAINIVEFECGEWRGLARTITKAFKQLPYTQPKTGKWIKLTADKYVSCSSYVFKCDQCGENFVGHWNFCPNCGARMVKE